MDWNRKANEFVQQNYGLGEPLLYANLVHYSKVICDEFLKEQKPFPCADEQLAQIRKMINEEQSHDKYHYPQDLVSNMLSNIFRHKRELVASAINQTRNFQGDVLTFLRAFSLMLETVASAATHGEKASRLRGLMELVESAARKIRETQFREVNSWNGGIAEDVFRCDYHVRHFIDKANQAEYRVKELEKELAEIKDINSLENLAQDGK
jgi:hypothetical protein